MGESSTLTHTRLSSWADVSGLSSSVDSWLPATSVAPPAAAKTHPVHRELQVGGLLAGDPPDKLLERVRSGWRVSTTCQRSRKAARPPRPVNDTWITGCCLVRNLPLATLNLKDFKDFADHDGLRVIGVNER